MCPWMAWPRSPDQQGSPGYFTPRQGVQGPTSPSQPWFSLVTPHLCHMPARAAASPGPGAMPSALWLSRHTSPPAHLPAFAYILPANPCQGDPLYCLYRSQGVS